MKRRHVDHTMYSTTGMLRTMELILGLPPMSQYDAAATPLWRCFTAQPDLTPYQALASNLDLDELNTENTPSAQKSIWKGVKGEQSVMPAPRRGAFVRLVAEEEEEGEED